MANIYELIIEILKNLNQNKLLKHALCKVPLFTKQYGNKLLYIFTKMLVVKVKSTESNFKSN